jgi:hypothetical protein
VDFTLASEKGGVEMARACKACPDRQPETDAKQAHSAQSDRPRVEPRAPRSAGAAVGP